MLAAKLLALPLALALSFSMASKIDPDYEGEVDRFTGGPKASEEESQQNTVTLPDGGVYDKSTRKYCYQASGSNYSIYSSVPDGMITRDNVSISYDEDITVNLYCDGELVEEPDLNKIKNSGKYSVVVSGVDDEKQILTFSISSKKTGAFSQYKLPSGFELKKLTIDEEEQEIKDTTKVDMSADGSYEIVYQCDEADVRYKLEITIDHTPPEVTFEGVTDGKARGEVTISGTVKSDTIKIIQNGEEISTPSNKTLTMPAKYDVTVTDDAGNSVKESFEIEYYINFAGTMFIILLIGAIGGGIGFMMWSRKHMEVR